MRVAYTDAMDARDVSDGQSFDTVVCLNVVEHVQDDLARCEISGTRLSEGGRAIILVPCGPGLYGTLDEVLGHFRRYTREQLVGVAEQAGFRVEQVLKFNRPGVLAWWLNGRILKRRTFGLGQIRMLNLLTPIFRLVDSWLPLPPLSLIAILRKECGRGSRGTSARARCIVTRVGESHRSFAPKDRTGRSVEEARIACVDFTKYEKLLRVHLSSHAAAEQSLGARRRRGLLRFCPIAAHRTPPGFHEGLAAGQRELSNGPHGRAGKHPCRTNTRQRAHLNNHFSVGPGDSVVSVSRCRARRAFLLYDRLGAQIPADGFSQPYRLAMAVGTADLRIFRRC